MHKDKLLAAGTLHDMIPCDAHAFIEVHQTVTTVSTLQAIPTLPPSQLATASRSTSFSIRAGGLSEYWLRGGVRSAATSPRFDHTAQTDFDPIGNAVTAAATAAEAVEPRPTRSTKKSAPATFDSVVRSPVSVARVIFRCCRHEGDVKTGMVHFTVYPLMNYGIKEVGILSNTNSLCYRTRSTPSSRSGNVRCCQHEPNYYRIYRLPASNLRVAVQVFASSPKLTNYSVPQAIPSSGLIYSRDSSDSPEAAKPPETGAVTAQQPQGHDTRSTGLLYLLSGLYAALIHWIGYRHGAAIPVSYFTSELGGGFGVRSLPSFSTVCTSATIDATLTKRFTARSILS
ncbi:unnamed protein product [Phytophthora fragariaefolia]|uniref:Unnamed protein product n=1 Tax=Phytophthora fragariaefolia TaxID=1490495 RepID=A0A9W6TR62_9STRA|nr:unnamed protein product [Phytophthora fragariaefolia]